MTIAKDFASKFAVAFVAVAMLFTLVAPAVNAAETAEDLQKTIADLLAQVAELEGKTADADDSSASCEAIAAPLTMGSTGANVTALQNRLIADGEAIAAGATGYFGAQTKAALASWQGKNSVSPAVGYYGPLTAAAMAASCDDATDEDEDDSDDDSSDELQGEGELSSFEIEDADDTDVQEGAEDAEIGMLTLEAEDGDIEVSRIDFNFAAGTTEDPWDVFETISLWVDGDMIAEFAADDEDEYLDEDNGEFRISGLDIVVMEDEEVEITVAATVMSSVDTLEDWDLDVDEIRYFDADGVATDEDGAVVTGETAMAFDIVAAGDGEELKFSLGDNNPDATDIIVEEDGKTDGVTILEYTIEAQEGDIELNTLYVTVETSTTTTNIVDDIELVVDGETFKDEGVTTNVAFTNTNTVKTYEFDIDGDVVVDEDEEVTVEVIVDFKAQDPNGATAGNNYANGSIIEAYVNSTERDETDAEGMDDVSEFSGTAIGEEHTIVAEGIVVPVDGFSSTVSKVDADGKVYQYELEFDVTAIEGDFYITDNAATSSSASDGVRFAVSPAAAGTASAVLESTGKEDTAGVFTVKEGKTETFTLTVTVDPVAAGSFRVELLEVWYSDATNGLGGTQYDPTPASDFRSKTQSISA